MQFNDFTNCGIRHIQDPQTFAVSMDQIAYINALKQMAIPKDQGRVNSDATSRIPRKYKRPKGETTQSHLADEVEVKDTTTTVSLGVYGQCRSLRGAVAYTLLTRADVSVYVVALQRTTEENTTWEHVKALNQVVVYLQSNPQKTVYSHLGDETCFAAFSDAAFKKEESTGHALKGTVMVRIAMSDGPQGLLPTQKKISCHVIDYVTKRVRNVTRSTFSAELFSLCDACDHAMLLRQIVHEFTHGALTADAARAMREGSMHSSVQLGMVIDAMSVYSAITANHIKIPAEKSLLSHLQYVRELLDRGTIA